MKIWTELYKGQLSKIKNAKVCDIQNYQIKILEEYSEPSCYRNTSPQWVLQEIRLAIHSHNKTNCTEIQSKILLADTICVESSLFFGSFQEITSFN